MPKSRSVALDVVVIPEGIPAVISLCVCHEAHHTSHMAKWHMLLFVIFTQCGNNIRLCLSVICSDTTGPLC